MCYQSWASAPIFAPTRHSLQFFLLYWLYCNRLQFSVTIICTLKEQDLTEISDILLSCSTMYIVQYVRTTRGKLVPVLSAYLCIVSEITLLRAGRLAAVLEFAFFQVCEAIPEFLSPSSTITVPA